jgi:UDP-N-acetyl-D-glucosamine dehydrogenase
MSFLICYCHANGEHACRVVGVKGFALRVAVLGLGYVGLPLAERFVELGHHVIGIDADTDRLKAIRNATLDGPHLDASRLVAMHASGRFSVTFAAAEEIGAEAFVICVPTPVDSEGAPDARQAIAAAAKVGSALNPGALVVVESTTYPGEIETVLKPAIERASGLKAGRDFYLAYSPERINPGESELRISDIPKLLAGSTPECFAAALRLYGDVAPIVPVQNIPTAEAAKALENAFRLVNIALVNEFKASLAPLDVDIWCVIAAARTKPFGFMPFEPSIGVGGHCIPVDPVRLAGNSRARGIAMPLIETAANSSKRQPARVAEDLLTALRSRGCIGLQGSAVLVCGVAYKPDVDDARESPSTELIAELLRRGANVDYIDPHISTITVQDRAGRRKRLHARPWREIETESYDCVLIATNHSAFDWARLLGPATLIVDAQNATAGMETELGDRLVQI